MNKDSKNYLGKLRSNFIGTQFIILDNGMKPEAAASSQKDLIRREHGVVFYQSNKLISRGPRKMTVLLPSVKPDGSRDLPRPMNDQESMARKYAFFICQIEQKI